MYDETKIPTFVETQPNRASCPFLFFSISPFTTTDSFPIYTVTSKIGRGEETARGNAQKVNGNKYSFINRYIYAY